MDLRQREAKLVCDVDRIVAAIENELRDLEHAHSAAVPSWFPTQNVFGRDDGHTSTFIAIANKHSARLCVDVVRKIRS